jgi:hypothetical protein
VCIPTRTLANAANQHGDVGALAPAIDMQLIDRYGNRGGTGYPDLVIPSEKNWVPVYQEELEP